MLWLAIIVLLSLNLVASVTLHSATKVVVLALRTNPSSVWEGEICVGGASASSIA